MFWTVNKGFLIFCLIILDILLIKDISTKKERAVAGVENFIISPTPSINNTPTILISSTPTPAPTKALPTKTIKLNVVSKSTNLLEQINTYRSSLGLSKFSEDPYTCDFANLRASEISISFDHSGFDNRANAKTLPYPQYTQVTENIAMNSDSTAVVPNWITSPGHNENLLKNTQFACIRRSGNYYAFESWQP